MKINDMQKSFDLICSECGKEIIVADRNSYVYKMKNGGKLYYQCNYNCMEKAKKRFKTKREQQQAKKIEEELCGLEKTI